MKKIFYILIAAFSLIQFTGCKSEKILTRRHISSSDEKDRFENLLENSLSYENIQAKVSLSVSRPGSKSMNSGGTLKLIKNEALQISLTPFLGIEAFRLVLTKDSLIILDRINSRYVAQSYSEYKDRLPIDLGFETVQALFMNNVFVPGDYDIKKSDYKRFNWSLWTENAQSEDVFIPGETLVAKVKNDDLLNLTFLISQENRLACTLAGQRTDRYKFQWKYSVFEPVNGIEFPKVSQVNLEIDNRQLELGISWSRMTIDGGVTIDKNIPKSYKKLDIKDLAGSLLK